MINIKTVEILKKQGYTVSQIMAAVNVAEMIGEASLDGWVIRYNKNGEMMVLHPSYNGIYIGDYETHVKFEKSISYQFAGFYMSAKYRDLEKVMGTCSEHKTNGHILCECHKDDFNRRKKQLEKLGYTVTKSNYDVCSFNCIFLVK